jgi:predicted SnoaL-like aldol condensation-catalyzing enzyme
MGASMDAREGNKALVLRFYAEMDAGNIAAMDEIVAVDYIDHSPPPLPDLPSGRDGLKKAFEIFWHCTPGTHEVLQQVAEDDLVVSRIRAKGTFAHDLGPIPATGGEMDVTATAVHRVADGKLVEHWGEVDSLRMTQQLGLLPEPQH